MFVRRYIPTFVTFAVLGFGPFLLLSLLTALALFGQAGLSLPPSSAMEVLLPVAGGLLALFVPLLVVFAVYKLYYKNQAWLARVFFVYLALLILSAGLLYVYTAGIAGPSIAAVEGAASRLELQGQVLAETLRTLLPVQLCLLPWLGVALSVLAWASRRSLLP
jgi:hypothetical protein